MMPHMGHLREPVGGVTIEERRESFVIHPGYGYDDEGERHTNLVRVGGELEVRELFCERWRETGHPEFIYDDLDDLIKALTALRDERK